MSSQSNLSAAITGSEKDMQYIREKLPSVLTEDTSLTDFVRKFPVTKEVSDKFGDLFRGMISAHGGRLLVLRAMENPDSPAELASLTHELEQIDEYIKRYKAFVVEIVDRFGA